MAIKKRNKTLIIILGSIILLLVILIFTANSILSSRADKFLREQLAVADSAGYQVDFRKVRVNIFTRSVRLMDVVVEPKASALEHVRLSPLAKPVYGGQVKVIRIGNIGVMKAIRSEALNIGSISITDPEVTVYSPRSIFSPEEKSESKPETIADSSTLEMLSRSALGLIRIKGGKFRWMNIRSGTEVINTTGISVSLEDITYLSPDNDSPGSVDVGNFDLALASHTMQLPDDFYRIKTGPLQVSYADAGIVIDSFSLIPLYKKNQFGKAFGKQTDRFDIHVKRIEISDMDFDSLMNNKVIIGKIYVVEPNTDIHRDKRVPRDMSHFPALFQVSVDRAPITLDVDSVVVDQAWLRYAEMVHHSSEPGYVEFDHLNIIINGINNQKENIARGQSMKAYGTGQLMGQTKIEAIFDLPIGRKDEYFTFQGKTEAFQLPLMNPLVAPLANIQMTAGTVNSVEFYGLARNDTAVGRIRFLYEDIELAVNKKDKQSKGLIEENRFLTALAKTVIHKNNPKNDNDPRIGKMVFKRDVNKGFFNYYWKTIQDGLINTLIPISKRHARDTDWSAFKKDWVNVLQEDRRHMDLNPRNN